MKNTINANIFFAITLGLVLLTACGPSAPATVSSSAVPEISTQSIIQPTFTATLPATAPVDPTATPAPVYPEWDPTALTAGMPDLGQIEMPLEMMHPLGVIYVDAELEQVSTQSGFITQGTDMKNELLGLVDQGALGLEYRGGIEKIIADYRLVVIPAMVLKDGYGTFAVDPAELAYRRPIAITESSSGVPGSRSYYYLVPRASNVYVFGVYRESSAEVIFYVRIDTGL